MLLQVRCYYLHFIDERPKSIEVKAKPKVPEPDNSKVGVQTSETDSQACVLFHQSLAIILVQRKQRELLKNYLVGSFQLRNLSVHENQSQKCKAGLAKDLMGQENYQWDKEHWYVHVLNFGLHFSVRTNHCGIQFPRFLLTLPSLAISLCSLPFLPVTYGVFKWQLSQVGLSLLSQNQFKQRLDDHLMGCWRGVHLQFKKVGYL